MKPLQQFDDVKKRNFDYDTLESEFRSRGPAFATSDADSKAMCVHGKPVAALELATQAKA